MLKKLTIEFIISEFEKKGYKLLSEKYINAHSKLRYRCPKGHEHSISWNNFREGYRCPYCSGKAKKTIEFIGSEFAKKSYKLLTKKYINCKQKLEYICPYGHRHNISWNSWKAGSRCPYCAGNGRPFMEFIKADFERSGYIFLSTEYKNSKQKLKCVCPNGHIHSVSWSDWQQNHRCPYCYGNVRYDIDYVRKQLEKDKYRLLSTEYVNSKQKFDYICPEGHEHSITWYNWHLGKRCPTCKAIKMSGSGHPNWQGGISAEPYCPIWLDSEFKQMILERDDYQCQNSDCWGTSEKLCGHHIDYVKKNCDPSNIITICKSCNGRANRNREYWTKFYREITAKKYGYVYGE